MLESERFDLAIAEFHMPVASGIRFLEEVRVRDLRVPVLLTNAYAGDIKPEKRPSCYVSPMCPSFPNPSPHGNS